MSFCQNCKELYGFNQRGNCPRHAYLTPAHVKGGACAVLDSTVANLSSAQFNHLDTTCDDECQYFFKNKIADMCQHNMSRCYSCGNCWDGFARCQCYKDPPRVDSGENDSSDEHVFAPKPKKNRSVSPDLTKP